MKVLYTTNFPSPYRVDFFNEFGKYCDLTVAYERNRALHRDKKWVGDPTRKYREVYLEQRPVGTSQSIGLGIVKLLRKCNFDRVIFCGYASPSVIIAIAFCRLFHKEYYLEFDGGFNEKDSFLKRALKRFIFSGVKKFLITCKDTEEYLKSYQIAEEKMAFYPFTSLKACDILPELLQYDDKWAMKDRLDITETKAIISVGSFIERKGFDVLIKAMKYVDRDVGAYIIGGEPTPEYLDLCRENGLTNVHFVPFCTRDKLFDWYKACDLFVFPTRRDIWGLVINEAMACGLPVISSDMCIAAKELLREEAGFLFKCEDYRELSCKINEVVNSDMRVLADNSLRIIREYTIEKMATSHKTILNL